MSKIKELENILTNDVSIEINEEIKAIRKILQKTYTKDLQRKLEYYNNIKKSYDEVLNHISQDKLSEKEANNILLDLEDMRVEEDEL